MTARSLVLAPLVTLALIGALSACTKSTPGDVTTSTTTQTITRTPSTGPTGPISTGTIAEKTVTRVQVPVLSGQRCQLTR